MTYGEIYRATLKAEKDWTGPERPDLLPGIESWYDDFWELSTDRQFGLAVGPLPHASIARHTRDWPQDDADMFRVCMRNMDEVFRNWTPPKINLSAAASEETPQDALSRIFGNRIN